MIYLEVDPNDPASKMIADLKLEDRNARGNVEFTTELELHKPVKPKLGNHRLIYFVNNRGNKPGGVFNKFMPGKNCSMSYSKGGYDG